MDKKEGWEKVADVENGRTGDVWKKGENYYFFDNGGIFQLIENTIYKISDKNTLEYLLSNSNHINPENIREFSENKKLISINGQKKLTATVKYHFFFRCSKIWKNNLIFSYFYICYFI